MKTKLDFFTTSLRPNPYFEHKLIPIAFLVFIFPWGFLMKGDKDKLIKGCENYSRMEIFKNYIIKYN